MQNIKKIKTALWVYWLLLFYIIAALIWWYISLENQNEQIYSNKTNSIATNLASYTNKALQTQWQTEKKRNTTKHLAEGITFLAIILFGAFYIYRIVKNQIKAIDQQNNFIMAVTHELKTPIAIAQLNIETLQKRQIELAVQQKLLANTTKELYRLNDLASNILVVSQLEKDGYSMNLERTNISNLVSTTVDEINKQHSNRVFLELTDVEYFAKVDPLLLKLVVTNLIDNALKYSHTETIVMVAINAINDKIQLTVTDNGEGISDAEKTKVFEKFYRQGNEITRTNKGTGLGLYLCKKIITDHKGNISIINNQPKGSIFTILLNQI